MNPHT